MVSRHTMETPATTGFMGALRQLGDSLLANAQLRLELFSTELQEEKYRLVQTLVWVGAVVFVGMLAVTFSSLLLVYLFWESARVAVLGGLALFYFGALLAALLAFRRFLNRQPKPFEATLEETLKDRACIQPRN